MNKFFPVLQHLNIPNSFTTLGMAFGVAACYRLMQGDLRTTFAFLFLAMAMDVIDGFTAGKLNQKTRFGQQMDSLVDYFICCVMPIFMIFAFVGYSILLIGSVTVYAAAGLWRLAHFNLLAAEGKTGAYFVGLPVPGAMLLVSISVWMVTYFACPPYLSAGVLLISGLLMASSLKIKKYGLLQKASWVLGLVFLVLVITS